MRTDQYFLGYLDRGRVDGMRVQTTAPNGFRRKFVRKADITGYYVDDSCSEVLQPAMLVLPHGRYLPGWMYGEGMFTAFSAESMTDPIEAWYVAHQEAERAAVREQEGAKLFQEIVDQTAFSTKP